MNDHVRKEGLWLHLGIRTCNLLELRVILARLGYTIVRISVASLSDHRKGQRIRVRYVQCRAFKTLSGTLPKFSIHRINGTRLVLGHYKFFYFAVTLLTHEERFFYSRLNISVLQNLHARTFRLSRFR